MTFGATTCGNINLWLTFEPRGVVLTVAAMPKITVSLELDDRDLARLPPAIGKFLGEAREFMLSPTFHTFLAGLTVADEMDADEATGPAPAPPTSM